MAMVYSLYQKILLSSLEYIQCLCQLLHQSMQLYMICKDICTNHQGFTPSYNIQIVATMSFDYYENMLSSLRA